MTPPATPHPLNPKATQPQPMDALGALEALARWLHARQYRFFTATPLTHARVWQRRPDHTAASLPEAFGWNWPFLATLLPQALHDRLRQNDWIEPCEWPPSGSAGHTLPASVAPAAAQPIEPPSQPASVQVHRWRSRVRFATLPTPAGDLLLAHGQYPTVQDDAVFFGPDTYRFAQAVADWLTRAQDRQQPLPMRALELCAGAAPAALLIKKMQPNCDVLASDLNARALQLAAGNSRINALPITTVVSDLFANIDGAFDLIVANPPYLVDAKKRAYRHGGGLYGAELAVRIVQASVPRLRPGGALLVYTGVAVVQGVDVFEQALQPVLLPLQQQGWSVEHRTLDPDVFGEELEQPAYQDAERIAAVVLRVSRPA